MLYAITVYLVNKKTEENPTLIDNVWLNALGFVIKIIFSVLLITNLNLK